MGWRDVVRQVAPGLAALAGGPASGVVVKVLAENILGKPTATEAELQQALAGPMTPELRKAILAAETSVTLAYLKDVADARRQHAGKPEVMRMGYAVLAVWALLTGGTLWGLYEMATGGIRMADPGLAATVFTLVGSLTGYVSNAAQQVLSYAFGSSRGSAEKTDAMANALAKQ